VCYTGEDEDRFYPKAKKFIEDGLRNSVELDSTRVKYLCLANYFNEIISDQNPCAGNLIMSSFFGENG